MFRDVIWSAGWIYNDFHLLVFLLECELAYLLLVALSG